MEELEQYIERRLDAIDKRYIKYLDFIDSRADLTDEEKQAHKGALWETTNSRTDELKRLRKYLKRSA